ncbi:MAG: sulfotransferase [Thermomonas sp.]
MNEMNQDALLRWQEAERLSGAGQGDEARLLYAGVFHDPTLAPLAHLRLALLDQRAGDLRGATDHALAAFAGAYADADLMEMLCKTLLQLGETHAALACATALQGMDASVEAYAETGKMLSDHMLPEAALPLLSKAMAKGLANAPAMRYLMGLNLMYIGRLDDARRELEACLRGNPGMLPAHWALAKVGLPAERGMRIERLQRLAENPEPGASDAALLHYSLFHELDRAGQPEQAWAALEDAMRLRRARVPHDEAAQDALFEAAIEALRDAGTQNVTNEHDEGPQPVFVVGMPRTGTTVIEQHLCAAADVASAGELRDLAMQSRWVAHQSGSSQVDRGLLDALQQAPLRELSQRYLSHTRWRANGHAYYADKWPENYLLIGHILRAMPQARVLCVRRSAADACFSNLKEWFAASYFYSYDMGETARQYARFDRLMQAVEALQHPRVAFIEYEDFVAAPESAIAGVLQSLGLPARDPQRPHAPATIATASATQARGEVTASHVHAWRRYETQLAPLLDELSRLGHARGGERLA